jgi:hypothetical protein
MVERAAGIRSGLKSRDVRSFASESHVTVEDSCGAGAQACPAASDEAGKDPGPPGIGPLALLPAWPGWHNADMRDALRCRATPVTSQGGASRLGY